MLAKASGEPRLRDFLMWDDAKLQKYVETHWPKNMEKDMKPDAKDLYHLTILPAISFDLEERDPTEKKFRSVLKQHFFSGTLSQVPEQNKSRLGRVVQKRHNAM